MDSIIQLLPDSVANQIAAGEVIQRPASVVKELMENSIDSGATHIQLVIVEAGKTLIQVIDNGCGMSETDCRMCFERHATSKIRKSEDLFSIRTMGFRGEAMASIAAIAHTDIKTKRTEDELGTHLEIAGTKITEQSPVNCESGTSIRVKNLFFNVPARRKFLKSNKAELRHIIDEFERVALANPSIKLILTHNDNELFHLPSGSFRQRIVSILGKSYNQKLVPVEEDTQILKISGFVGKPEAAKKSRGEQFFFVNQRFIKNAYLNHAVTGAYDELLQKGTHPSYFLNLTMDTADIDINIHPTKTEIKFEDEKAIYSIIRSSVRQALGQYNIAPSIDFEQESSVNILFDANQPIIEPKISVNPNYNPFKESKSINTSTYSPPKISERQQSNKLNWKALYDNDLETIAVDTNENKANQPLISSDWETTEQNSKLAYQLHNKYILTHIKSGLMLINQQRAHQRILYEIFLNKSKNRNLNSQQLMFPETLEFGGNDYQTIITFIPELKKLGFEIREFGKNSLIIDGMPEEANNLSCKSLLEELIENQKLESGKNNLKELISQTLSSRLAVHSNRKLEIAEMHNIIDQLFSCEMPYASPFGKKTVSTINLDELDKIFNKQ